MNAYSALIVFIMLLAPATAAADPTRPPTDAEIRAWLAGETGEARPARWQLQSVLVSDQRRVAIINGRRYQVGDRIGPARVIAIAPDEVILDHQGEAIVLNISSRTRSVRQSNHR